MLQLAKMQRSSAHPQRPIENNTIGLKVMGKRVSSIDLKKKEAKKKEDRKRKSIFSFLGEP